MGSLEKDELFDGDPAPGDEPVAVDTGGEGIRTERYSLNSDRFLSVDERANFAPEKVEYL